MGRRLMVGVAASLASVSIGASTVMAQGTGAPQGQTVTISFQTPPTRTITVVTIGTAGVVSTAQAGATPGTYVLPGRDFANGKAVEIWRMRCDDARRVGVIDPTLTLPATCTKTTPIGSGTWTMGGTISAIMPPPPGGLRFSPYALGGMNFTYTTGVSGVVSDLEDLFEEVGAPTPSISSQALDFGWQFGGGVRLSWTRKIPAIDVSYLYSNVGGPSINALAADEFASLDLDSQLQYRLNSLRFGAKFKVTPALHVTPMVSYNWWKVALDTGIVISIQGEQLLNENLRLDWSDSDWGFGARVDYKFGALGNRLPISIYGEAMLNLIRGNNDAIYGEGQLPPWPPDHKLFVMSVGVKYSFKGFRIGERVQ